MPRTHPADVNTNLDLAIEGTRNMIEDAKSRGDMRGAAAYTIALQDLEAAYRTLGRARSEQSYGQRGEAISEVTDVESMEPISDAPHRWNWRSAFLHVMGEIDPSLVAPERTRTPKECFSNITAAISAMKRASADLSVVEGNRVIDDALKVPEKIAWKDPWKPCDACAAKPGAPVLCKGCLWNRTISNRMSARLNTSAESLYPLVRTLLGAIWKRGISHESVMTAVYEIGVEFQKLEKTHGEIRAQGGVGGVAP